jgi:hypothetical protein
MASLQSQFEILLDTDAAPRGVTIILVPPTINKIVSDLVVRDGSLDLPRHVVDNQDHWQPQRAWSGGHVDFTRGRPGA